jgi:EAL domain-containing protein (putative c-di-GMP-specific phosphodiesterase class I)
MQIMGKPLVPSVSMGTAMYPQNGIDTPILLHCADIALYVVKGQGRNGHKFFEPSFNQARLRRTDLEFLVRKNVVSRNFELHYQPYFSLHTWKLEGFEALLRMKDSHGKYISPAEFVPVAEDLGLINEIGAWVLSEACRFAKDWPKDIKLSVNLSTVQFRKKTACTSVLAALNESGLNPQQLVVEITESVLLTDVEDVRQQIVLLNSYGVELAMDDFGTGYSSLSYILRLPFNRLKIDRSFVSQLSSGDDNAQKIVETIISLGHTMKMSVTAEGVETEGQAKTLMELGCDQAQGFLFSKPVPASEVSNVLMKAFVGTAEISGPESVTSSEAASNSSLAVA